MKLFWYMEFRLKSRNRSQNDGNQVQQLVRMRNFQEVYQTNSSNLIWNCFDIWNSGRKDKKIVEMTEFKSSNLCEWEIVKKFTKPSPATWFENVLIYGIQVEKPKTELKWRNPSPATWVSMRNCQEIYQNQVQQLDLKMFWYVEFMSTGQKQSQNPSPATWSWKKNS